MSMQHAAVESCPSGHASVLSVDQSVSIMPYADSAHNAIICRNGAIDREELRNLLQSFDGGNEYLFTQVLTCMRIVHEEWDLLC